MIFKAKKILESINNNIIKDYYIKDYLLVIKVKHKKYIYNFNSKLMTYYENEKIMYYKEFKHIKRFINFVLKDNEK